MDLVRGLSPEQKQAIRSSCFFPNLMVFVDWPSAPLRFNMRDIDMIYQGETYAGFGPAAEISLPSEAPGIAASTAMISIAGVDHDLESRMTQRVRGSSVTIHMALMSASTGGYRIGAPIPLFRGVIGSLRMKTASLDQNTRMSRVEVDLSTGPSARTESSIFHTNEDQSRKYPNDTAGRLVILAYAKAQKLRWPE